MYFVFPLTVYLNCLPRKHFKMLHKCNKCEYQTPYKANYRRHLQNKHTESMTYCAHCDYKSTDNSGIISHIDAAHCCSSNDECGIRRNARAEVQDLINKSFQNYIKMKIESAGVGNEEMIENITDIFKYCMLKKINE